MTNPEPLVSVQVVVHNGARYLRRCLDAVAAQTYPNIELWVFDNASTDDTQAIVKQYPNARLITSDKNLGMWPGQERLLDHSNGEFVLVLSVDVALHPSFIAASVAACQHDPDIAAVQGKVYQWESTTIDTCGFGLTRGRQVINIGHGKPDGVAYSNERDIFGVEGAVPFFRRSALEACRIGGQLIDPDYFWYGDDFDLAWRMTLFGHRQRFLPSAVAWHDRSTTKGSAQTPVLGQLARRHLRAAIPIEKRRLDWANVRFTIIKNDATVNLLRDAPFIAIRELATLAYAIVFEPGILKAYGRFIRLLPTMLRRRRLVQARAVLAPAAMHRWFL